MIVIHFFRCKPIASPIAALLHAFWSLKSVALWRKPLGFSLLFLTNLAHLSASELQLPDLGDASSGLISPQQEQVLGQQWLRMFRAQVPTSEDPFFQSYTEKLIAQLSTYSQLDNKRLDVLIIENPTLNAFAVPGGIIGIQTGLFRYAKTEQQLSSVIAHELAHLSQRHYARQVEKQKNNAIPTLAAILAGIVIAAAGNADAGMAAISVAQASALDAQLRFSRKVEQEADRIGMETLIRAQMSPYAMVEMFEEMMKITRYQRRPPEFLLTHPITESRVNDSQLRAQRYPVTQIPLSPEYQLIRTRAKVIHEINDRQIVSEFRSLMEQSSGKSATARYGLALSLIRAGQYKDAKKTITPLVIHEPHNIYYSSALAVAEAEADNFEAAESTIKPLLKRYPNSHPLNVRLAEILMKSGQYQRCEEVLLKHVKRRPKDSYVWYLLAETHGLAGNILEVHTARAEYFILNGLYDKAEIHLKHALKMVKKDRLLRSKIEEKLKATRKMRKESRT